MKITIVILIGFGLHVSATTLAQKVSLSEQQAPLEKVFQEIHRQTGYLFFYNQEWLKQAHPVSLNVKNMDLKQALDICFKDQPYNYAISDNTIYLRQKTPGSNNTPNSIPPPHDVRIHVIDSTGQPLEGANVVVKGMKQGGETDAAGNITLAVPEENIVITVSYVGYETKEIIIGNTSVVSVVLKASSSPLDEIQMIAYGMTTRRLNTGNVTTIKAEEIENQPVTNVLSALEGRVPGMFVTQSNGMPGSVYKVQIRGQNSILNGNDPLYVIDGIPYFSQMLPGSGNILGVSTTTNGQAVYGNPLSFINPADIESIDILKDADATAIYGSRGANGVVLITTKKGKFGKTSIDFGMSQGVGRVAHEMQLLNTPQYLQMRHEALENDNVVPTIANSPDFLVWDTTRNTNWQRQLLGGTAHYTDVHGNISGGSANTQYLIGGTYHRETTVFPGDFADQKGSLHFSLNSVSADQKFRILFSGNYQIDNNHLPASDLTSFATSLPPDAPLPYNVDGSLNWAYRPGTTFSTWPSGNPYAYLTTNYRASTYNLVNDAVISYRIIPGLDFKTNLGYTFLQDNETNATPLVYFNPALNQSSNTVFVNNNIRSWIAEPQLTYQLKAGKNSFNALLGTSFQQTTSTGQILTASGFSSDLLQQDIQAATTITTRGVTDNRYKYSAVFGRINYNYANKYLLNFTTRRDGSSRFGPGNQFHDFSAVGAAWLFYKEKFINDALPFLSFGKLRSSYGTTGNDQIGDYRYLNLYNASSSLPYQNIAGLNATSLYNPDLAWEINKKFELGVELGFLKDRINLSISYFRNRSSNQLVNSPLSSVTGFTSIAENLPATVQNTGLEFLLNIINIRSGNFSWSTSFNLTSNQNKLIAFPGLATSSYSTTYVIGQPINIKKVFNYIGVDPSTGVYQFKDGNGNPTFSPNRITDLAALINVNPKFYGGLQNSISYSHFELDFLFQFVKQTGVNFLYDYPPLVEPGVEGYNQPVQVLSRWQHAGQATTVQQFSQSLSSPAYNAYGNSIYQSTQAFGDASYIRLKNLSLSYSLPFSWVQKLHAQNCKVFLQSQNLLTITNHYIGLDPESQSITSLPPLQVVIIGFQATF